MNRSDVDWQGFWVAAPTPYGPDHAVDVGAIGPLVDWYLAQGVRGILCNGTTGEWFSQSSSERRTVAQAFKQAIAGRVPLVVGCTAFTPDSAIELAQHACEVGADGVMSTPPPYAQLSEIELVEYFRAVSGSSPLPFLIYNWPIGTSVDIAADTAVRLVGLPNVVAFKESTPNTEKALHVLAAVVDEVRVFMNFRSAKGIEAYLTVGGDGFIGGGALLGRVEADFFTALDERDLTRAGERLQPIERLYGALFNPDWSGRYGSAQATLKAAMRIQGLDAGVPRPPLLPITDPEALEAIGVALSEAEAVGAHELDGSDLDERSGRKR